MCLSLEVHCSLGGQRKIARYLKKYMGERIVMAPSDQAEGRSDGSLPSPWELRGKILVKGKTVNRFQGAEEDEDETEVPLKEGQRGSGGGKGKGGRGRGGKGV